MCLLRKLCWWPILPVKLAGGTLAIGAGLALGREGPTVQMGAAVGAAVAEGLRSPTRERLTLPSYPVPPREALPAFVLLGSVAGLLGVAFNRGLLHALDMFGRPSCRKWLAAAALVGATANCTTGCCRRWWAGGIISVSGHCLGRSP